MPPPHDHGSVGREVWGSARTVVAARCALRAGRALRRGSDASPSRTRGADSDRGEWSSTSGSRNTAGSRFAARITRNTVSPTAIDGVHPVVCRRFDLRTMSLAGPAKAHELIDGRRPQRGFHSERLSDLAMLEQQAGLRWPTDRPWFRDPRTTGACTRRRAPRRRGRPRPLVSTSALMTSSRGCRRRSTINASK